MKRAPGGQPTLRLRDGKVEDGFDVHVADFDDPKMLVTFDILGDVPDTARTDCPTIGKMNQPYLGYPVGTAAMGLRHLFNHASLHAVDCIEPQMPSYDFVSVAVNVIEGKEPFFVPYYLKAYQSLPWAAIDYQPISAPYYMFGTALFALYLEEAVGDGDGRLLSACWEHAAQDGHILKFNGEFATADVPNQPDFLAAVDTELKSRGTSLEAEYVRFAEWRFFLAGDADAAHFAHGAEWTTGKVAREATLTAAQVPVAEAAAVAKLAPTGMGYVELTTAGLPSDRALTVSFTGNPANRWAARVLRIPSTGVADAVAVPLADDHQGSLAIENPTAYARIVLVVVNLGQGAHDTSLFLWSSQQGDYTYGLALQDPVAGEDALPDAPATTETGASDEGTRRSRTSPRPKRGARRSSRKPPGPTPSRRPHPIRAPRRVAAAAARAQRGAGARRSGSGSLRSSWPSARSR